MKSPQRHINTTEFERRANERSQILAGCLVALAIVGALLIADLVGQAMTDSNRARLDAGL